ncbi:MAG: signal recognition particle protein Srp54 [Nanoarchaeota archaeon]
MVLEKLGDSLKGTLAKIANAMFVDDKLINELVKDIQRAQLSADVNVKLVLQLTETIRNRIKTEKLPPGLTKKEQLINIVYSELVTFVGGDKTVLATSEKKPMKIMMVGLFGAGKTKTTGKIAKYFAKRSQKVALVGLDVHRPAAMTQLQQLGKQVGVQVFADIEEKNALALYHQYEKEYAKYDVLIIDTAGRDTLSDDLITEISAINSVAKPDEVLLVIGADIGQTAQTQAQKFHDTCGVTGVIVTKMDGTAKGGGALTACAATGAPVKFIGVGERVDDLEAFNPKGFIGRLLGMGDLETLLEKAKEAISEDEAKDIEKKLLRGEFNLLDLYQQMEAMSKMGPLGKVLEMIPGMGSLQVPKEALQVQEGKLKHWRILMDSMTRAELEDPDVIDAPRIDRIAKGAGLGANEVRDLLKQYKQSKKLIKMMKGGGPEKLMKQLQQGKVKMR